MNATVLPSETMDSPIVWRNWTMQSVNNFALFGKKSQVHQIADIKWNQPTTRPILVTNYLIRTIDYKLRYKWIELNRKQAII